MESSRRTHEVFCKSPWNSMTKIFFKVCSSFWACEGRRRGNDTCKDGEAKNRKFSFSCSSMKLTRIAAWKMFGTQRGVRGEIFSILAFIILARFPRKISLTKKLWRLQIAHYFRQNQSHLQFYRSKSEQ